MTSEDLTPTEVTKIHRILTAQAYKDLGGLAHLRPHIEDCIQHCWIETIDFLKKFEPGLAQPSTLVYRFAWQFTIRFLRKYKFIKNANAVHDPLRFCQLSQSITIRRVRKPIESLLISFPNQVAPEFPAACKPPAPSPERYDYSRVDKKLIDTNLVQSYLNKGLTLHEIAKQRLLGPRISRATIYRRMHELKNSGNQIPEKSV